MPPAIFRPPSPERVYSAGNFSRVAWIFSGKSTAHPLGYAATIILFIFVTCTFIWALSIMWRPTHFGRAGIGTSGAT